MLGDAAVNAVRLLSDLEGACNEDLKGVGAFNKNSGQCLCSPSNQLAYYAYDQGLGRRVYTCQPISAENLQYGFTAPGEGNNALIAGSESWDIKKCIDRATYRNVEEEDFSYFTVLPCLNANFFLSRSLEKDFMVSSTRVVFPDIVYTRNVPQIVEIVNWLGSSEVKVFPFAFLPPHQFGEEYLTELSQFDRDVKFIKQVSFELYIGYQVIAGDDGVFRHSPFRFQASFMKDWYFSHLGPYYMGAIDDDWNYTISYYEPDQTLDALKRNLGLRETQPASHLAPPLNIKADKARLDLLYSVYNDFFLSGQCFSLEMEDQMNNSLLVSEKNQPEVWSSLKNCSPFQYKRFVISGDCLNRCTVTVSLFEGRNEEVNDLLWSRSLYYVGGILISDFIILERKMAEFDDLFYPVGLVHLNHSKEVSTYHILSNFEVDRMSFNVNAKIQVFDRKWNTVFDYQGLVEVRPIVLNLFKSFVGIQ